MGLSHGAVEFTPDISESKARQKRGRTLDRRSTYQPLRLTGVFMSLTDLIPTLQLSISPVILISGIGLILLSMTNRFGRVIDRSRLLNYDLHGASEMQRATILAELRILSSRGRIVRTSVALAALSALLAAFLIISLFLGALFELAVGVVLSIAFILCMLCLISALLLFLWDINLSLTALWLDLPPEGRSNVQRPTA